MKKRVARVKHRRNGMTGTLAYNQWRGMLTRCYNTNSQAYKDYGGRGITVCDRWRDEVTGLQAFIDDMGLCPEGKQLDRMNNNKGYSKKNCRWATRKEQKANCRNNIQIHFGGETKCLEVWCRERNLDTRAVLKRRNKGVALPALLAPTPQGYTDWNKIQRQRERDGTVKRHQKTGVKA